MFSKMKKPTRHILTALSLCLTLALVMEMAPVRADEYDTKLLQDYLKGHPIMLAYGIDGEPLEEDAIPCRIIIRYSDSAYWVRQVTRIELVH